MLGELDGCQNQVISKMAMPQPSPTIKQSSQADLLPMPTATMTTNFGSQQLTLGGKQFSQAMVQPSIPASLGPYQFAFPNNQSMTLMLPSNDVLPVSVHLGLQQSECTSKSQSLMEPLPRIQNHASVNIGSPFPLPSIKQQARMGYSQKLQTVSPTIAGPHQLSSINKRPAQPDLPVKAQEVFESVRSKLRESLASALATCSNEQNKSKSLEKSFLCEEKNLLRQADSSLQNETTTSTADGSVCESLSDYLTSNKQVKENGKQGLLSEVGSSENIGDQKEGDIKCIIQEGRQNHNIVLDDTPFSHSITEDELLQGHGLCWASDSTDTMPHSSIKKPKLINIEENKDMDMVLQTSENLAAQIEAELFKLFGGVNKKYKEKGRSLLFNLKDPSNPELRERVLSGDVPPERLCSMSAEDLASRELSQWRQAKAEEFAHMVMLPDTNIDIRRLVRKTHKGEFQVEVEQDDGAHPEVGLVSDVLSKTLAKATEVSQDQARSNDKSLTSAKTHDLSGELVQCEKSDLDARNISNLDPTEKTDFIQDFMVEETKDTELLPPVVSLDEFMQDLDSEPPFENLDANNLEENTSSVGRNLDQSGSKSIHASDGRGHTYDCTPDNSVSKLALNILDSQSHSMRFHTEHTKEISSPNPSQVAYNYHNSDDKMKSEVDFEKHGSSFAPSYTIIWDGFLQLNVSSLSNVVSFYLSGEKTSMQGWPSLVEVKGRVRLDAFEKFLQEVHLSRSRAIMMVEFSCKENTVESGQVHLSEAVHSYITDERVGFAEPAPGVELYLCPPHPKVTGMLARHLSKELLENVNCIVNGLVGIVVWRRPHVIVSPRMSSHHKHGSTKKHSSSRKHHDRTSRSNLNTVPSIPCGNPNPQPEEIDDVPPGFGPRAAREVDDLPEFDFSRGNTFLTAAAAAAAKMPQHSAGHTGHALPPPPPLPPPSLPHPSAPDLNPTGPTSHMRELIQKYGQGRSKVREFGIPVQPWNDDDDIPEWNPNQNMKQMPQMQSQPMTMLPPQMQGYQQPQPNVQPFMVNLPHLIPAQQPILQPNPQFFGTPLLGPVQPQIGGMRGLPPQNALQQANAMWLPAAHVMPLDGSIRPCHFGGQPSGGRLPVVGPRMGQGFGGPVNGSGFWRPDNSRGRGF